MSGCDAPSPETLPPTKLANSSNTPAVTAVQLAIVSLGGNELLNLDLPSDATFGHVREVVMDALPEKGPVKAFQLGDQLLDSDVTLADAGLFSPTALQVIFGLGETAFSFEGAERSDEKLEAHVQVFSGALCDLEDVHTRISASEGLASISEISVADASDVQGFLHGDLREGFTADKHSAWSYNDAITTKPREGALLKKLLYEAHEVSYFRYEIISLSRGDPGVSYSSGVELLVDGDMRISLRMSCMP